MNTMLAAAWLIAAVATAAGDGHAAPPAPRPAAIAASDEATPPSPQPRTRRVDTSRMPLAVTADPPRDKVHPARNRQLVIPSNGKGMNALFLLASGPGPKPTMLLLHGLPGNERNLDLAQAVRRAGWNVLTFTYRGAWGSEGSFSVHHALDDARAALEFLRQADTVREFGLNPSRLVIAGHSMGGFAAAWTAAQEPDLRADHKLAGVILLDAWDIGRSVDAMLAAGPAGRQRMIEGFDDLGHALGPITAADLADNLARRGSAWHLAPLAPRLASLPVLSIWASHGLAVENRAFADALRRQPGADLLTVALESDHAFADKRVALAATMIRWLEGLR